MINAHELSADIDVHCSYYSALFSKAELNLRPVVFLPCDMHPQIEISYSAAAAYHK